MLLEEPSLGRAEGRKGATARSGVCHITAPALQASDPGAFHSHGPPMAPLQIDRSRPAALGAA